MRNLFFLIVAFFMVSKPGFAGAYTFCNAKLSPSARAGFERALPSIIRQARKMGRTHAVEEVCPYYANGPLEKAVWVTFTNQRSCKIWLNEDWSRIYLQGSFCSDPFPYHDDSIPVQ